MNATAKRLISCALALCVTAALPGCGGNPTSPESSVKIGEDASTVADLKNWLDLISKSGEGGSSVDGLSEAIDKAELDATIKASLKEDLAKLQKAKSSSDISKIAAEMAAKIPAGSAASE